MSTQKYYKNKKTNEAEDRFKNTGPKKPGRNIRLVGDRFDNRTSGRIRSTDVQAILDEEEALDEIDNPRPEAANSFRF